VYGLTHDVNALPSMLHSNDAAVALPLNEKLGVRVL
jgi:hypothetical protein